MVQALGNYIQSIAMVIIFTTMVNLIMPSGDFTKYVKMVLGFIVIITILAPINTIIFKNKPDYTDILQRYETDIENTTIQFQSGQYLEAQKDIILDSYKEKLKPQMIDIIERGNKVAVLDLDIGFDQDTNSDQFGKMTTINMVVEPIQKEVNKKRIKIPEIKVGTCSSQA